MLSVSSTVKLSSSLTSISLASPTEKNSLQNPFWYSLDGDEGYALAAVGGGSSSENSRGAYYALVKNPEKSNVQYQQAQQQTEDRTSTDEDEDEDEDDSSEKIIHL